MNTLKSSHFVTTLAGVQMPRLIYGTAWKKEKTTELVIQAVTSGFRGIDTACQPKHYREDLVGKALASLEKDYGISRDALFIQTKFTSIDGQDPRNIPYDKTATLSDQVYQSFEKSLSNLNTDWIDSLVLHSPMRTYEDTITVWKIFEEFVEKGKVKQIGISNIYSLELFKKIWNNVKIKPSVIQNRFYADTEYDNELRAFCRKEGVCYQSFWTLTANPFLLKSTPVKTISTNRNLTPEQVFFKFTMQIGIVPLTGTTNEKHVKEDLNVLDVEDFTEDELSSISSIAKISY